MMPGLPLLGAKHYQEVAPGASLSESVRTPAGEFKNAMKVSESTPLEPFVREKKHYTAGIGLVQDGSLKLVRYGKD